MLEADELSHKEFLYFNDKRLKIHEHELKNNGCVLANPADSTRNVWASGERIYGSK